MFETERLNLRTYRENDLDEIQNLWNDPLVQKSTAIDHVVPRTPKFKETVRGWLDHARFHVIIELKGTGEFVGYLTLRDEQAKNRDGDLAITILRKHWSKGYGTEVMRFIVDYAFRSIGLHRVSLGTFAVNERGINLYKKVGFVEEGRIRKSQWIDGGWHDLILMGIVEDEWSARTKASQA